MNTIMSRRSFLKFISIIFGAGAASACERVLFSQTETAIASPSVMPKCGDDDFSALAHKFEIDGVYYEANVPDTLDLAERAEMTINALTRCTNPEENYDAYFFGELRRNPPVMYLQMQFPYDFMGKWWEGLALMRYVTGSSFNNHVDQQWRENFISWFREKDPLLQGPDGGRVLCWIANNFQVENNPCWNFIAEEALRTLLGALTHRGDISSFTYENGAMKTGWDATYQGWTLQGITSVYAATGSPTAKRLAGKLARYLKDYAEIFDKDGKFLASLKSISGDTLPFHHNGNVMVGISEYALTTRDQEYAAFAKKGYEYALLTGSPLVGFFPENIAIWNESRPYIPNETCCTVDMIMLAINLTKLEQGDYWDDVDRYVRNQFIEMQMVDGRWIIQVASKYGSQPVGEGEDGDQIAERAIGSFAGWALANDYQASENEPFISACCTGNAARALYYVWENMISYDAGKLQLHLLLNRASPWADINSYIPYEGRVDIETKVPLDIEVRIPEWVKTDQVLCSIDGDPRKLVFRGRYALADRIQAGSLVTFTFPISERTVEEKIGDVPYKLIIKGNDVVSISPSGKYHPFYQRAHYRENKARWVNRSRFVRKG